MAKPKRFIKIIVRHFYQCDESEVAAEKSVVIDMSAAGKIDWNKIIVQLAKEQSMTDFPGTNLRFMTLKEIEAYEDKESANG